MVCTHFFPNNCPIWKIQNLAYSGSHGRHIGCQNDVVCDVTPHDVTQDDTNDVIKFQSLCLTPVAKLLLWGLSPKPWGRFCDFFACELLWPHRIFMQKFSTIGLIGALWHNSLTDWNFQILFLQLHPLIPRDCPYAIWTSLVEKPGRRCM